MNALNTINVANLTVYKVVNNPTETKPKVDSKVKFLPGGGRLWGPSSRLEIITSLTPHTWRDMIRPMGIRVQDPAPSHIRAHVGPMMLKLWSMEAIYVLVDKIT